MSNERADRMQEAVAETPQHRYLSTACLHYQHSYCSSKIGHNADSGDSWTKTPASCKFCRAACSCICHVDIEDREALRKWMSEQRDPDKEYPVSIEEFTRLQRERLMAKLRKNNEEDQP